MTKKIIDKVLLAKKGYDELWYGVLLSANGCYEALAIINKYDNIDECLLELGYTINLHDIFKQWNENNVYKLGEGVLHRLFEGAISNNIQSIIEYSKSLTPEQARDFLNNTIFQMSKDDALKIEKIIKKYSIEI